MLLDGGTVSQLRGLAWLALRDTGHVGAGTIADDSGGGGTVSFTYGAAVPCRIDPLAGLEGVAASRLSDRSTHLVTAPPETPVTVSGRFSIEGRGTFEVTAVRERTGESVRFFEVVELT